MFSSDDDVQSNLPPAETKSLKRKKTRQLTIKGVDEKTIEMARIAAEKRGLRVSAWIRMELQEAASRVMSDLSKSFEEDRAMREMLAQLETLLSQQRAEKTQLDSKLEEIRQDMTDLIRLQHKMVSKAL